MHGHMNAKSHQNVLPSCAPLVNQRYSNCNSAGDIRFVKLSSDCFFLNKFFTMDIHFHSDLCCSIPKIYRQNPKQ